MDYAHPDIPGLAELWGTSVIHCPFCHGWEVRDTRVGLLAASEEHRSTSSRCCTGCPATLRSSRPSPRLRAEDGVLRVVVLPDGSEVERDVLFVAAPPSPRDAAFAHLELERTDAGLLEIDYFGRTSTPGVYAAGDLVAAAPAVVQALATGQRAAVGITRDLAGAVAERLAS